jgi:hypothetical protein
MHLPERAPTTALIIRGPPLAAKSRLSRSSRLGTHTRLIQARLRAARSSPPRPLWLCIVDMQSRFSEGLPHDTQPPAIGRKLHSSSDNSPTCKRVLQGTKKRHRKTSEGHPATCLPRGGVFLLGAGTRLRSLRREAPDPATSCLVQPTRSVRPGFIGATWLFLHGTSTPVEQFPSQSARSRAEPG